MADKDKVPDAVNKHVVGGIMGPIQDGLRKADAPGSGTPGTPGVPDTPNVPKVDGPAAKIPLRPVSKRHDLNRINAKTHANKENTIVLPGTDTNKDIADIQAGKGKWNAETNRYEVNGRVYGVEQNGTVFPCSGPGLVNISQGQYRILQEMIKHEGDLDAARAGIMRNPRLSEADFQAALNVFQHHKSFRGGS